MPPANIIEIFYQFFQGILLFQVIFFGVLYILTKRKELIIYCCMIFVTSIYFFLNAPDTFFNLQADLIFETIWYPYVNFALLLSLMALYLLFLKEVFPETSQRKEVATTIKYTLLLIPLLYLSFSVCVYFKYNNDVIFYAAHLLNGPFCTLLLIHNWKTKSNHKLLVYGLIITFVCVVLTMLMTIKYNQGNYVHYIEKYPLLYIRIGMLLDILLFQLFLMRHWVNQEKELATQKIKKQLEIVQYKNQVNHALHDDIGTSLSKINLRSYMALQKMSNPGYDASSALQSIQSEVQLMIDKIKNILSDDPTSIIDTWKEEVHTYALEMCELKNIKLQWKWQEEEINRLTNHQKYQIVLIAKEAINNAVKYSACSTLQIDMKQEKQSLRVTISDNGLGFDVANVHFGNGLRNMKIRAESINGSVHYTSQKDKGSTIELTIKT